MAERYVFRSGVQGKKDYLAVCIEKRKRDIRMELEARGILASARHVAQSR